MYNYHVIYLPKLDGDWSLLNDPDLGFIPQIIVDINYTVL